jgi:hypothetical protein
MPHAPVRWSVSVQVLPVQPLPHRLFHYVILSNLQDSVMRCVQCDQLHQCDKPPSLQKDQAGLLVEALVSG